jgi:hypothetical protein
MIALEMRFREMRFREMRFRENEVHEHSHTNIVYLLSGCKFAKNFGII